MIGKLSLVGFVLMLTCNFAFAEIITLDTGEKIEANVIRKTDKEITIDYKGSPIIYYNFEIKSIDAEPLKPESKKVPAQSTEESVQIKQVNAVSAEEYLKRGIIYYNRGNFDQAISDFNKAIKVNPNLPEVYLNRGLAYMGKGDTKLAFSDYDKAIAIKPKYEEAYYVRGLSHATNKQLDEAIVDYGKAIELNPQYVQAYLNRGFLYVNKGLPEKAIVDFDRIIKINPTIAQVYYLRGIAYANKSNLQQAIADYSKAIELEPQYVEAYANRALAYVYRSNVDLSKSEPNSPKAFVNIGPTYNNKADLELGISDCTKAIGINAKYPDSYIVRARIYMIQRNYDLAWADVHKAQELDAQINPQIIDELKAASGKEK